MSSSSNVKNPEIDELLARLWAKHTNLMPELDFFNSVFSFVNRRSTYLAEGSNSKKVLQLVSKYTDEAKALKVQKDEEAQRQREAAEAQKPKENAEAQKPKEVEKPKEVPKPKEVSKPKEETKPKEEKKPEQASTTTTDQSASTSTNSENKEENKEEKKDEDKKKKNYKPPVNNGGITENYIWTQTLHDLEIRVLHIPVTAKAKDLHIVFEKDRIEAGVKGKPPLLQGELNDLIIPRECTWTVDQESGRDTKTLTLAVKKKKMRLWTRVIVGEEEIDTEKIAPETTTLQDLDVDTRQQVEKLMVEQRQKMMGIPTEKELEERRIIDGLRKAFPETDFSQTQFTG